MERKAKVRTELKNLNMSRIKDEVYKILVVLVAVTYFWSKLLNVKLKSTEELKPI